MGKGETCGFLWESSGIVNLGVRIVGTRAGTYDFIDLVIKAHTKAGRELGVADTRVILTWEQGLYEHSDVKSRFSRDDETLISRGCSTYGRDQGQGDEGGELHCTGKFETVKGGCRDER